MSSLSVGLQARINILNAVLTSKQDRKAVSTAVQASQGDLTVAIAGLKDVLPKASLDRVELAQTVAAASDDNLAVVKAIAEQPNVASLRDVALRFDTDKLADVLAAAVPPPEGTPPNGEARHAAVALQNTLYATIPSAVLQRMVQQAEIPISDTHVRAGVVSFLDNQPDFNIRTTSIYTALKQPDAWKGIAEDQRPAVLEQLKTLQRVQALSTAPEAVPILIKAGVTSAFHVTEKPERAFLASYAGALGEETARAIYTQALNTRIRNEQALMTLREAARGTGLGIIDGAQPMEMRLTRLQSLVARAGAPIDLDTLFGGMDFCECGECTSVYSAAAYFVELLQFLRNNDLDPANPHTGQVGIAGTPLEKLFRRRPDLGCLQLTCENTNTVLPYVDLANEVMESFVVHLGQYHSDAQTPKQAQIDVFNVDGEASSELLAEPQHTNYQAYCILKNAVYPFTLPYHQPIDAIRIFLKYLGTSRRQLVDFYRGACDIEVDASRPPPSAAEEAELRALHQVAIDRAVDAEALSLTQEEYIILTKEAFWPKRHFDIVAGKTFTDDEYRQNIGVKPVYAYYGYAAEADMLSADETAQLGLTFVKKQLLVRSGVQYLDLVGLLKTRFINPGMPQGEALAILDSIRFSYRFLQTLVDSGSTDPKVRFAKLVAFLNETQTLLPLLEARMRPDPCQAQKLDGCLCDEDLSRWVYCYFEVIGKLIVLESGEGPMLPIEGELFTLQQEPGSVGTLHRDGRIVDAMGAVIGNVTVAGLAVTPDGKPFVAAFGGTLTIRAANGDVIGYLDSKGLRDPRENRLGWMPATDSCDLDKVRLVHLDGTAVTTTEYDRLQRFVRLWQRTGFSIDETDKALVGLGAPASRAGGGMDDAGGACEVVDFASFDDSCPPRAGGAGDLDCPNLADASAGAPTEITPRFLHQLVAVRELVERTGQPVIKLLAFWADISTAGDKSLYKQLFLTHNLLGIDTVFQPDGSGRLLALPAKSDEHLPVLMAALKLKAADITAIEQLRHLDDALTLANVSTLYRHGLLAKVLHVKVPDMAEVIALFGDPFTDAHATLALLDTWAKMEDAGFTFGQLDYVVRDHDSVLRPLAPSQRTILRISKGLYDGLTGIDHDHPDVTTADQASATLVSAKAGLLFDQPVVEGIMGLLEGTSIYTTNAPAHQTIVIPASLATKLKYDDPAAATPPRAAIHVTGILTDAEKTQAKLLSAHPEWAKAIDRVGKQALNFYNDVLAGIFPDGAMAKAALLAGDLAIPPAEQDPTLPDPDTAPAKRFFFLRGFMPFLRQQLADRLVIDTMASAAGLTGDLTKVLLTDVLVAGTPAMSALRSLEAIKDQPASGAGGGGAGTGSVGWKGYFIPSSEDAYTFVAISDTQPAPLVIDGQPLPFPHQQEDPSNVWSTDPLPLKSGTLYPFQVADRPATDLQFKTARSPKAAIPASALLPDYSEAGTREVFVKLYKAALVAGGFALGADEVAYLQAHGADFGGLDFNAVTLQGWKRLQAYAGLRDGLPGGAAALLNLFKWTATPDDPTTLSARIAAATAWSQDSVDRLIAPAHFDLAQPDDFHSEANLVKLKEALDVATAIGADIDRLFDWANPVSKFWVCRQIAEDIRKATRARFDQEDWEQVVKPLNDQLREHQRQALVSYLLVQPDLIDWGVVDADSLFEFFLIDVQMDPCLETSRIKQAISTVQLFVQRCLLGLEAPYGVPNDAVDRDRWEWMQKYRVWEANRKVFLYPENWIDPALRDDKSPFYKELESELLQKDINTATVEDALKSYLFKVDEVANLKVAGLFFDQTGGKLHVFARTRNAPYFFYYRYFDSEEKNWYAWEKIQIDIPTYDVDDNNGQIVETGTYLVPVVWNNRLLLFFPQFMKKNQPASVRTKTGNGAERDLTTKELSDLPPGTQKPSEFWEIKLGWSEYRNKKWTQKQVSKDAVYDFDTISATTTTNNVSTIWRRRGLPDISHYRFVPRVVAAQKEAVVEIYRNNASAGAFHFMGSQVHKGASVAAALAGGASTFHYVGTTIHSLQAVGAAAPALMSTNPVFDVPNTDVTVAVQNGPLPFHHPFVHELLGTLTSGNLDDLYDYYGALPQADRADAYGADTQATYHELKRSYSLYNWEAGLHAPMQLADRLLTSQQFDQALTMCHHVFNPLAQGTDPKRVWAFPPFQEIDADNVVQNLLAGLAPNQPNDAINEWRNHPFQPHVVARSRPAAYMKWVVMKYIEILIAYGDYFFRQNTLETIPMAIQLYVLAAHIYGPRGQQIPKRGEIAPATYNGLLNKWDAFGNAMVELELAFPFSNQTPFPIGASNGVVALANVFGFATTLYFCIPDNPNMRALRDTINDRLFKIRHCEDINGVVRKLPLFEPPIDPALLIQAAAQGLSLSSVLNDLNSPMPNYRFVYLLQKALELCAEVRALGAAFVSAKEKYDGEALSLLRAKHESSIQNLMMEVRKQQLDEANRSLEALQQSRKGPVYRLQHQLKLIGEDLGKVPDGATDFGELPDTIEQPIDESGLKLISLEKEELDKATDAASRQVGIGQMESIASILHAIPTIGAFATPIGVGANLTIGGSNFGSALQGVARWMASDASKTAADGANAGRKASFLRQLQERVLQANSAGYEIKNIDGQILTQQIRINVANQELINQQKQIDNAQEVEEFLRDKYTNADLYTFLEGSVRSLYYQAYTLAYDLAKRAEKVFRFERGLTTSSFIQFGYWEAAHDGLMAGERMYTGLKELEAAYQENRGYDFELVKHVSLRQLNPVALLTLKETGRCEVALPEVVFDMDHPGHYMRRIKSVALTVPCVVGPYTGVNCTLRLLEHKFRTSAIAKDKSDYLEKTDEADDRFTTTSVPISSIAVGAGQNDSGVFELNFRDERYIPFEGAGAISKWRIELPEKFRQFDYDTITDVIIHLRFTAVDGGDKLMRPAADAVQEFIKSVEDLSKDQGLFAVFDLRHEFPGEWYRATQTPATDAERTLALDNINERLPIFTKGKAPAKILASDIYIFSDDALPASAFTVTQGGDDFTFSDGPAVGGLRTYVAKELECPMGSWTLKIANGPAALNKLWLVARYVLRP